MGYTELQIATQAPSEPIKANLDELRSYLELVTKRFEGVFFSDEQMKLAKQERAGLRNLKEQIESKRKALKKAWNAPYLAFEEELKKVLVLVDKPILLIDGQVKDYEARQRKERKEYLENVFNQWNTLGGIIKFDQVLTDEMMKLSLTPKKAEALLDAQLQTIKDDIAALEDMVEPEFRTAVLNEYSHTLDFKAAAAKQTELKRAKAEQERVLGEVTVADPGPAPKPQIPQRQTVTVPVRANTALYWISGTPDQIQGLFDFCEQNKIIIKIAS